MDVHLCVTEKLFWTVATENVFVINVNAYSKPLHNVPLYLQLSLHQKIRQNFEKTKVRVTVNNFSIDHNYIW